MTAVREGIPSLRAAELAGITFKQLDYWDNTELVSPSVARSDGSGTRRRYSYNDILLLAMVRAMLDAGIGLPTIRRQIGAVRQALALGIEGAYLVMSTRSAAVARHGAELVDVVHRAAGEGALSVIALDDVRRDLDSEMRRLYPTVAAPSGIVHSDGA